MILLLYYYYFLLRFFFSLNDVVGDEVKHVIVSLAAVPELGHISQQKTSCSSDSLFSVCQSDSFSEVNVNHRLEFTWKKSQ